MTFYKIKKNIEKCVKLKIRVKFSKSQKTRLQKPFSLNLKKGDHKDHCLHDIKKINFL